MATITKTFKYNDLIACTLDKTPVYFVYEMGSWQQKKPFFLELVDIDFGYKPTVHWLDSFLDSDNKTLKLTKLRSGIYQPC